MPGAGADADWEAGTRPAAGAPVVCAVGIRLKEASTAAPGPTAKQVAKVEQAIPARLAVPGICGDQVMPASEVVSTLTPADVLPTTSQLCGLAQLIPVGMKMLLPAF
jgi:hypothetical protein